MNDQFKKLSEQKLEKILKLYRDGFTMVDIAKKLEVSKTTVRYHLVKMKVKLRSRNDYFSGPSK